MDNPANIPDIDYKPPQPQAEGGSGTGKKVAIGCSIGCLTLIIVAVVAGFLIYNYFINKILSFTTDEAIVFVEPVADEATIQGVITKFDTFQDAMANGKPAEPLVMSGDDINLLIYNHPKFAPIKGFGQAAVEEDRFTARISVPLDNFGEGLPKKFQGRFLNGEATIRFLLNNGYLEVYLVDLKGPEGPLPESVMSQMRGQNLMKDAKTDQDFDAIFRALEDLKVEDGKIWIVPKPPEDRPKPSGGTPVPASPVP